MADNGKAQKSIGNGTVLAKEVPPFDKKVRKAEPLHMVRMTGVEPACLATYEPKSYVSANSTTSASALFYHGGNFLSMRIVAARCDFLCIFS